MKEFLEKLKKKQNLSFEESKSAFNILMNGEASEDEIYDFLKKRAIRKGKKITKYGWIPDPLDNYLIN